MENDQLMRGRFDAPSYQVFCGTLNEGRVLNSLRIAVMLAPRDPRYQSRAHRKTLAVLVSRARRLGASWCAILATVEAGS